MILTSVTLLAGEDEVARFNLKDSSLTDRYMIKAIVGLDATEIVPKFYGFGATTKPRYFDMVLQPRELVFRVALNPQYSRNESPAELRDEIYKGISASRSGAIELQFNSGASIMSSIIGFITKIEVPYFSRTPEIQLTVFCEHPMFRSVSPVIFTADILSTGTPIKIPDSISTAPHGFDFQFTVSAPFTNFVMRDDANSEWLFEIIPGAIGLDTGFLAGDIVNFSSDPLDSINIQAANQLTLTRAAVVYPIANKVTVTSIWPMIFPGANEFYVSNSDKFAWDYIRYYAAYWGV